MKNASGNTTGLFWPDAGSSRRKPMLRKVLILSLLLSCLLVSTIQAAKSYEAQRYDVDLAVQEDGSLVVTETVVFGFEGGPFTYVFRDLAYTEIDAIDRLQASMDGQVLPQGTGPGQVEIQTGDPLQVTWHFAPTSDSTHTFTLVYRVQGAIRQLDSADALSWRAIPEEHDYEIAQSTITLSYPQSAELLAEPEVRGAPAVVDSSANPVIITAQAIDADQDVVVQARFAPGSLISAPPAWQAAQAERAEQTSQAWPLGVAAGVLTFVASVGLLAWFWRRHPRPRAAASAESFRRSEPPVAAPPAVAAKLAGGATPALGTLFDLAQRSVLRIEEIPGRWGRKFTIQREASNELLRPHEHGLLEALFHSKAGLEDSIDVSKVGQRLGSHSKQFSKPLDEEMIAAWMLDEQRRSQRSRLIGATALATLLGGLAFGAGMIWGAVAENNSAWEMLPVAAIVAGLGAGLFLAGFIGVILGASYATLTAAGEDAAAAWHSFRDYLKDVSKERATLLHDDLFDAYLPYAAGFGLAEGWAKRYQKQTSIAVPAWFSALDADDSSAAFIAVMAATHSSVSSSGAGGAAGAAGASGGGASGAG
jgi:hypothetical protein